MSTPNLFNLFSLILSIVYLLACVGGVIAHINYRKTSFNRTLNYFGSKIVIENTYFSNRDRIVKQNLILLFIFALVLLIMPTVFFALSVVFFGVDAVIWIIGYITAYSTALIFFILYYKKQVAEYAKLLPKTNYDYKDLKKINIEVIEDYSFALFDGDHPIMRNRVFKYCFKGFKSRYHRTTNSYIQYRVIINFLNRFSSIMNYMQADRNCFRYSIVTSTNQRIPYSNEILADQILLTLQSIINQAE